MNAFNIIIIAAIVVGVVAFVHVMVNKGERERPPWRVKVWLIPLLAILVLIPISFFTIIYFYLMETMSWFNHSVEAFGEGALFTGALLLVFAFLLSEVFIQPLMRAVMSFILKRKPRWAEENIVTIILDTCIIMIIFAIVPSIQLENIQTAFSLSVFIHIIDWLINGAARLLKRK
ncbi:uncharacterized BrkB/YihY/UPF0761 family membrane protein [Scopulibacillus daqui]|uniref:Uncharacterized BrkB/YihY/UPF0761 family membrane protein n=1 Tax=Scopulibacillus daqui TaxID=1469162 RepID=A0ABS2Q1C7_9BACL|nr:hypothetical protein [Scopulibacillus daqui]MBM7645760.1 uncharacterized BrkB/YihY/UPF0761 family membrane protein [Scopulibacillus daqui]